MDTSSYFTEEDRANLMKLPPEQVSSFMQRLADIQMGKMVADSNWEKASDKLLEDTRTLTKDIKDALAKV